MPAAGLIFVGVSGSPGSVPWGQVWLGSGHLACHQAILLAAGPEAGYCAVAGARPKPRNGQLPPWRLLGC